MRWVGHVAGMGDRRGACGFGFVGGPDGKKLLERYGRLWADDIKNDLQEVGWRSMAMGRDRWRALVNVVMNFLADFGEFLD